MSIGFVACQNLQVVFSIRDRADGRKIRIPVGAVPTCSEAQPSENEARSQLIDIKARLQQSPHSAHHRRYIPFGDIVVYRVHSFWR